MTDWDDRSIPLGKRKQSFVKWALTKGISLKEAKLMCYRRFRHEIEAENQRIYWKNIEMEDRMMNGGGTFREVEP